MGLMLETARKYVANGWSVFPVPAKTKEPIIKWGKYRETYATDEELVSWFGSTNNGIGIACGKLSNLSVLDADGKTGIGLLAKHSLTSSGTVITGSGGKHLYYQYSGERNKWTSEDHEGLDLRGEGGYVLAPPSMHESGMTYRWVGTQPSGSITLPILPSDLFTSSIAQGSIIKPISHAPWIVEALQGVRKGLPRHGVLVKLLTYWMPRHSYEVVKHMALEWNQKNDEPYPDDKVIQQVNDINKRFLTGQYKSTFVLKEQENSNASSSLEISSPSTDADTYLTSCCTVPAPPELPTGFNSVDEATWGIHRGDVFTIGARPGTGKTSFAINVAANLCKAGKRVLYFSTEMSKDELYNAISSSQGGVDAFRLSNKQLNESDKHKLIQFLPELKTYDIHHVKFFTPDIAAVALAVEQIQPDLLVIDHIQHIASGDNKYAQIDHFIKFLKKMAMEKQIAVLVASQLKRKEDGLMPEMSDLKECGTIEEESSIVILMHSSSRDTNRPVLFRLAKNRHGKCGDTTLLFDASITKFADMSVKVA